MRDNITEREENMDEKQAITIFTSKLARRLLKAGFTIIDIKPDKSDEDGKRTIFIFKYEDGIVEKMKELK